LTHTRQNSRTFFEKLWKEKVENFASSLTESVKEQSFLGKRLPFFLNLLRLCISTLSEEVPYLTVELWQKNFDVLSPELNLTKTKVADLSDLELTCLASVLRLFKKVQTYVNTAEAFHEYTLSKKLSLAVQNFSIQNFSTGFQSLTQKGLLKQIDLVSGFSIHCRFDLGVSLDSLISAMRELRTCPTWITEWLSSV
jgi:hypothetical protein